MDNSESQSHKIQVIVAFLAICIIWGTTFLAIRYTLDTIPPFLMAGSRFLVAGLLLYAWVRFRGAPPPRLSHWWTASILGALLLGFGNIGVVLAEKSIPTGLVSLLVAMTPVYVVLINWWRPGGTRPTKRVLAGLLIGFAGMIGLIGPANIVGRQAIDLFGVVCVVVGCVGFAVGTLYSKTHKLSDTPMLSAAMQMVAAGAILLFISLALGEWRHFHLAAVSSIAICSWFYLIAFGSLIGYSAYIWLLRHVAPSRVITYAYVNPIIAVFLGWIFLGESFSLERIVSAAITLFAVWMITGASQAKPIELVDANVKEQEPALKCSA